MNRSERDVTPDGGIFESLRCL